MVDGPVLSITQWFEVIYCCNCRMPFAVPADVRSSWVQKGTSFRCPNGHSQCYTESEVQKLQKQLEAERKDKEWYKNNAASERSAREQTERQLRATRGASTRLRKRIKNGVCPCCNRTFINLQRHMTTQHPSFEGDHSGKD